MSYVEQNQSPILLRPDLQFTQREDGSGYAVKDPVALKYFLLGEEEYAVLRMLDSCSLNSGQRSVGFAIEEIQREFEACFRPKKLSQERILSFLARAQNDGLLIVRDDVQFKTASTRIRRERRQKWTSQFLNPLVFQWRGVDPTRFLNLIYPRIRFLFSLHMVVSVACLAMIAFTLVCLSHQRLTAEALDFHQLVAAQNLSLLVATFVGVKVLHELGHALACKHFGGECHELGVMFVILMPLLYCNVSDAWMFRRRWRRVAVSLAGVVVELAIASVAAIAWAVTETGPFNSICRSLMIVCSVNTLLVNGNPLLRFDGYFVLADLVGMPNLWSQSRTVLQDLFARTCLGVSLFSRRALPSAGRGWLAAYAVLSIAYRVSVVMVLLFLFKEFCIVAELRFVFPVVVLLTVIGMVWPTLNLLFRVYANPVLRMGIKRPRLAASVISLVTFLAIACLAPFPCRVNATATIQPRNGQRVYVMAPGILHSAAEVGADVRAGETLTTQKNLDIELALQEAASDLRQQEARITALTANAPSDEECRKALPIAERHLDYLRAKFDAAQDMKSRLTTVAPVSGTILPTYRDSGNQDRELSTKRLARWTGCPLDLKNRGCFLEQGSLLCTVGDPNRIEAVLVLNERDVRCVEEGQRVKLRLPGIEQTLVGELLDISRQGLEVAAGDTAYDWATLGKPIQTLFEARVVLDETDVELPVIGLQGSASVAVESQTLASMVYRTVRSMLRTW